MTKWRKSFKKVIKSREFYIVIAILILGVVIELRSGQFFTSNNFVNITRALIIPGMFTLTTYMVLVSGGPDVSYPAIATLSMYIVTTQMLRFEGSIIFLFLAGALLGALMGAVNGVIIAKYRFPTLIVTLGTSAIFTGVLQGVLGAYRGPVPAQLDKLGQDSIFEVVSPTTGSRSMMPVTLIFFIVLIAIVGFIMNRTMLGRGIYAIGGDIVAAERAGFNVFAIQMFLYIFVGAVAGFTGVTQAAMTRYCHTTNLFGMEMNTIAAAVLGGTSVTGGKGTIWGALLGILLLTIVNNSMILLGISTNWQKVFTGMVILIGTGVTSIRHKKADTRTIFQESVKEA